MWFFSLSRRIKLTWRDSQSWKPWWWVCYIYYRVRLKKLGLNCHSVARLHWLDGCDSRSKSDWLTGGLTALPPTLLTRQGAWWRCRSVKYKQERHWPTRALFELQMNCRSISSCSEWPYPAKINQHKHTGRAWVCMWAGPMCYVQWWCRKTGDLSRKSFDVFSHCHSSPYHQTFCLCQSCLFPLTQVQQIRLVDSTQWKTLPQTSQTHTLSVKVFFSMIERCHCTC